MRKRFFGFIYVFLVFVLLFPGVSAFAAEPSVTAYSAIVMDFDTGEVLFEKDADTKRVPASMTKIMTAYIVYEEMAAGNLTKDSQVTVSKAAADMSRDTNYPMAVALKEGGSYTVDQLLKLIMIPSASASCYAVAEHISGSEAEFVKRMNETAKKLNMQAEYENSHGAKPHYITCRSVAELIRVFIEKYPDILNYTSMGSVTFNGVTYGNTNRLLPSGDYAYPGADGFKTGTIPEAGYCLSATAQRDGHRLISVVMHSSSTDTRHTDSQKLLDYGFEEITRRETENPQLYRDTKGHWAKARIETLATDGIMTGDANGYFRPKDSVTREEFLSALNRLAEKHGVSGYAAAAADDRPISREDMSVILYDFTQLNPSVFRADYPAVQFADLSDMDESTAEAISTVSGLGLISGYPDGSFRPHTSASRAEAAVILSKLVDSLTDAEGLTSAPPANK